MGNCCSKSAADSGNRKFGHQRRPVLPHSVKIFQQPSPAAGGNGQAPKSPRAGMEIPSSGEVPASPNAESDEAPKHPQTESGTAAADPGPESDSGPDSSPHLEMCLDNTNSPQRRGLEDRLSTGGSGSSSNDSDRFSSARSRAST